MSLIPKISAKLTELGNKIYPKPEKILSASSTEAQPFLNNCIQSHDVLELTSDGIDELNSQIQQAIFEEKTDNQTPQMPKLSFIA